MWSANRTLTVVALLIFLCSTAYAPIYSLFLGLRYLIAQSDVIAVATILEQLPEYDLGTSARYRIEFTKVLKGKPRQMKTVAWLRHLEITPETEQRRLPSGGIRYFGRSEEDNLFLPDSRCVLFLTKCTRGDGTLYENVNCEGSSFAISPLRNIDSLKVGPLEDTLILLFREYVDFKGKELKKLKQQLGTFVHENGR